MKSSSPVPDILRSALSIDRFSVVTGPIGIIAIVAILSPMDGSLKYIDAAKMPIDQPGCAVCPHFSVDSSEIERLDETAVGARSCTTRLPSGWTLAV